MFSFSNAFLFHIAINEFICNVYFFLLELSSSSIHHFQTFTLILSFYVSFLSSFIGPLDQCQFMLRVNGEGEWARGVKRPFGKSKARVGGVKRNLNFMKINPHRKFRRCSDSYEKRRMFLFVNFLMSYVVSHPLLRHHKLVGEILSWKRSNESE